jgi:hypothetical protein
MELFSLELNLALSRGTLHYQQCTLAQMFSKKCLLKSTQKTMFKVNDATLRFIQASFADPDTFKIATIQMLWSGYGEIARYYVPSLHKSVIAKLVMPPTQSNHPKGWNGQRSHQRKLDSYINESIFYKQYSQQTNSLCRIPSCYFANTNIASNHPDDGTKSPNSILIMEDLDQTGFSKRFSQASLQTAKLGVRWLANFHAKFLNQNLRDVWSIGTYWHLATRPDEYARMPESELKRKASKLDHALNNARFQTLLHGDAKLANFCFSENTDDLAAVDFQYVGRGVGVKDLMYFLGSCFDTDELALYASSLIDEYFSILRLSIENDYRDVDVAKLEGEWRALLPFVWADFERFLVGWATEHYKVNAYMKNQTSIALANC